MSFLKNLKDKLPEGVRNAHESVIGRIPEGIQRAHDTIQGIINPNHRHDDPEEKQNDDIRAQIRAQHRFESFAPEREQNSVKWHIDGHDYMWAVSEIIDSAKEAIFILDWWLTPELYLRRPPAYHPEWRLDRLLKRKAEQGVKIYVIVYKEVTQTMNMSSKHTKSALQALHPNIAVMRHPDHIGAKDNVALWSHHEKLVVVDNHFAAVGGLDLCFGRWDTQTHPLADVHPTDFERTLFPGQDYNNARVLDFVDVYKYANNAASILETPRMPWHDVHMTLTGDAVLDLVQHFVERWNEVKKRKYGSNNDSGNRYDWLALPHNIQAAPEEPAASPSSPQAQVPNTRSDRTDELLSPQLPTISPTGHPHREEWHEIGRRFKQRFHIDDNGDRVDEPDDYPAHPAGSCRVQAVRSVSDWSHGVLTEHSIQNAYVQMIMEANHFIYIENQFFISNTGDYGPVKNLIAKALVDRILMAARDGKPFMVVVFIPEVPGFAGDIHDQTAVKVIMAGQYRTINRGGHSIYEDIRKAGYDPDRYIRFYHLRAYDRINGPYASLIRQMEQNSGVTFYQAQVALAKLWIGDTSEGAQDKVAINIPNETGEGVVLSGETKAKIEEVPLPATAEEARQIIESFEHGSDTIRGDEDVSDSVAQHMLSDRSSLLEEKWHGTEDEERNAYVTELLYIHSKLMIVDDRRVIMGSANINDRSQKGDGDSEICLVVEDTDQIETTMNGQPYMAGRFAATLRRKLYREHLGLIRPQLCQSHNDNVTSFMRPAPVPADYDFGSPEDRAVADPLSDKTEYLLGATARKNREIFTELFRPVPSNLVRDWKAYEGFVPKVKTGHVVPEVSLDRVKQRLSEVRGAVVECPLDFLIDQDDFVNNRDWAGLNPTIPVYI